MTKTKLKKLVVPVLLVMVVLTCIGLIIYPAVSNLLYENRTDTIITEYQEAIEDTDGEVIEAALKQAQEYNEELAKSTVVMTDPFQVTTGSEMSDEYAKCLNLNGDGIMGYIEIPSIDVKLNIFHGTTEESLRNGVGHMEGSSLPVGGEGTHSVLTGHSGLSSETLFTDLDKLTEGDLFFVYVLDETLTYEVDQILVVEPYETDALRPVDGEDLCTLVTCTPYGVNTHRLLVRGHRVETPVDDDGNTVTAAVTTHESTWAEQYRKSVIMGICTAAGIVVLFSVVLAIAKRVGKKKGGTGPEVRHGRK